MQGRPGRFQLKLPSFLASHPTDWAIQNNWHCPQNKPGTPGLHHPHVSLVHAAIVAKVAAMPYAERRAFLLDGVKLVFAGEKKHDVPGRERVRLYQSDRVRPAGIAARAA
jgi:hypothetical protein